MTGEQAVAPHRVRDDRVVRARAQQRAQTAARRTGREAEIASAYLSQVVLSGTPVGPIAGASRAHRSTARTLRLQAGAAVALGAMATSTVSTPPHRFPLCTCSTRPGETFSRSSGGPAGIATERAASSHRAWPHRREPFGGRRRRRCRLAAATGTFRRAQAATRRSNRVTAVLRAVRAKALATRGIRHQRAMRSASADTSPGGCVSP